MIKNDESFLNGIKDAEKRIKEVDSKSTLICEVSDEIFNMDNSNENPTVSDKDFENN